MVLKSSLINQNIIRKAIFPAIFVLALVSCNKEPIREVTAPPPPSTDTSYRYGVYIVNEGNFMWGNASVSYVNPVDNTSAQDIFFQANGRPLGDVAQMMKVNNELGFIVVNNSNTLEIVTLDKFKSKKQIDGFNKPRCIEFVNDLQKAYVTNLVKDINVIDLKTLTISKTITTPNWTEGMVRYQNFIFFSSIGGYQMPNAQRNPQILVVDAMTDKIVDSIKTGKEPLGIVIDKKEKVWVLCTGGYDGFEPPSLLRIDPALRIVEQAFAFPSTTTGTPSRLCINGGGDTLYYLDNGVFQVPVKAAELPATPLISPTTGQTFYGLGIDPGTGNIFVSDAIDYIQNGKVYQFNQNTGDLVHSFDAGRIPGSFCFSVKPSSK